MKQYQKKVCPAHVLRLHICDAESLIHRRPKIQSVLQREHEIAKQQLAAGNKKAALTALRKRKYQESLLAKTDGQLENLEKLVR